MKNGKLQKSTILYLIISKIYKVQAISKDKNDAIRFADLIGGVENCFIIETSRDKIDLSDAQIANNLLYECKDILVSGEIDSELMEFIETKHGEMSELMVQMLELIDYYKFTGEEQVYVNRFMDLYEYYFIRDIYGCTCYDLNEEMEYTTLIKMYLNTVRRNKYLTQ